MLTYADVCRRVLTCADVCCRIQRMEVLGVVRVGGQVGEVRLRILRAPSALPYADVC
jgi:hypothetical protein